MTPKGVKTLINRRDKLINGLVEQLEKQVNASQGELYEEVMKVFDKLEKDANGQVTNTIANKRLLASIDGVFTQFGNNQGYDMAATILKGVQQVIGFNDTYYSNFAGKAQLLPIQKNVVSYMKAWLGVTENGWKPGFNGYLDTVLKPNPTIQIQVKDILLRGVAGQNGWMATKDAAKSFLTDNSIKDTGGIKINQYYRNLVYDTYSHADRVASATYSDKLGFEFAIYEGGIIKTTREFCRKNNGKVFHKSEIAAMEPKEAIPDNYDPFIDMGGYGCRHHWNWIPTSLALIMRPDAKSLVGVGQE
jgi:hypothetical protein